MRTEAFDYDLPAEAIADVPVEPRDASRLLVVGDPIIDTTFSELADHLDRGDLLVRNATRVRAARLHGVRPTGGSVELLLLGPNQDEWNALAKPARKLRPGMPLVFGSLTAEVTTVGVEGRVRVRFDVADAELEQAIADMGVIPYPPYVTTGPHDRERYQTVYGHAVGSAAAPTAGLHFTDDLLARVAGRGVDIADIYLDIGLDTFRPISTREVEDHEMHRERYVIPAGTWEAVHDTRADGGRVVAVGTTVVRALEAAAVSGHLEASTDLFIQPGHRFAAVDALLTNFHLPRSTLLVLLAAALPNWRGIYAHALGAGYRFLSFGDAMFLPEMR